MRSSTETENGVSLERFDGLGSASDLLDIAQILEKDGDTLTLPRSPQIDVSIEFSEVLDDASMVMSPETKRTFSQDNPYLSRIMAAWYLTRGGKESKKRVIHMELGVEDSFHFSPGDAIGIICPNAEEVVEYMLMRTNTMSEGRADRQVTINSRLVDIPFCDRTPRLLLQNHFDVSTLVRKPALLALSYCCADVVEKQIMQFLCSREGRKEYQLFVEKQSWASSTFLPRFNHASRISPQF